MRRIEHPRIKFPVLPEGAAPEVRLLLVARGLRAFGDGLVSLILPVYLLALGYGAFEAGVLASATLAGSALLTLIVGLTAHRASGRVLLMGASVVMLLTGVAFAVSQEFWPLLLVAFVGTLNPSTGDVSVFLPLEQAQLAHLVSDRDRTRLFARYSFARRRWGLFVPGSRRSWPAWRGWLPSRHSRRCLFSTPPWAGSCSSCPRVCPGRARAPSPPSRPPRLGPPAALFSCLRPCSVSTRSRAGLWCSRSWRCGCSSGSASRWPRRA